MLTEFKKFIARGNVVDMAVGIIIGAAFTAIVTSMVQDLINPVMGLAVGGLDFSEYYINLGDEAYESLQEAKKAGAPIIAYGLFLNAVVKFLIVAFVLFLLVRAINKVKEEFDEKAADPADDSVPVPADIKLLTEIRDLLKKQ